GSRRSGGAELGAEQLRQRASDVGRLLFAFGGRRRALGERFGGVGDLVVAAAADGAGFLRFGEIRLHQARQLGEAAETDHAGGAAQSVGFGAHRLEIGGRGGETGRDDVTAAPRLVGEGLEQSGLIGRFVGHLPTAFATASSISSDPKPPSIAALTTPSPSIAKSHGSLGRWNARTWGRTARSSGFLSL